MTRPPDAKEIEKNIETIPRRKEAADQMHKILKKQQRCEIPKTDH